MRLIGLMLARNEDWVIGMSARAALRWVDALVIFDHASTDRTPEIMYEIMSEYKGRVFCLSNKDADKWDEMDHRQETLLEARSQGATHIAIIDADEVLISNMVDVIRPMIQSLRQDQVLDLPMYTCWKSLDRYRNDNSIWSNGIISLAFKDSLSVNWKKAGDGYQHHNRVPYGMPWVRHAPFRKEHGGVMHLQHSNWRRCRAKQFWYRVMEAVRWPGRKTAKEVNDTYNQALDETNIRLSPVPNSWWEGYLGFLDHVSFDGIPWYEEDIKRFWRENDPHLFDNIEIPGEIIDPSVRPVPSILDAKGILWLCESCGLVGVTRYRDGEKSEKINQRMTRQHTDASKGCAIALKAFRASDFNKDVIIARMKS